MYKFLAGMTFMAAVAAFFTNPDLDDAEKALRAELNDVIASNRLDAKDGLNAAALLACRVDPNTCYDLLRSGIDMTYESNHLYAKLQISGFNRSASCFGMYDRFFCPGGLKKQ